MSRAPGPKCDRKDFMSMKNPLTPDGIELATYRFVAQHLNHCATAVPKMWSTKWYFKSYISCDAHLLNELLWTDVPWDGVIVVSAGKLRELWDSLSELRSSVCQRRLERTALRPALLPVKTAQFTQNFRQVWRHTVKSLFNWRCIADFRRLPHFARLSLW